MVPNIFLSSRMQEVYRIIRLKHINYKTQRLYLGLKVPASGGKIIQALLRFS